MARWVGIGHDISLYLAMAAQWIDNDPYTDPFRPLYYGARTRRIYHFPVAYNDTEYFGEFDPLLLFDSDATYPTIRNCPMASQLINLGFEHGDLLLAAEGIHTLEDSFAHSRYTFTYGHREHGHWPDRPYWNPETYKEMIQTMMSALVAFRELLPASALDDSNGRRLQSAKQLFSSYIQLPQVDYILKDFVLRDPNYTTFTVRYVLGLAQNMGIIYRNANIDELVKIAFSSKYQHRDTREILDDLFFEIGKRILGGSYPQIFNIDLIRSTIDVGRMSSGPLTVDDWKAYIPKAVDKFTDHVIPYESKDHEYTDFEEDQNVWEKEMFIRRGHWQGLISSLFGADISIRLPSTYAPFVNYPTIILSRERDRKHFDSMKKIIAFAPYNLMSKLRGYFRADNGDVFSRSEILLFEPMPGSLDYQNPQKFLEMVLNGHVKTLISEPNLNDLHSHFLQIGYGEGRPLDLRQLSVTVTPDESSLDNAHNFIEHVDLRTPH